MSEIYFDFVYSPYPFLIPILGSWLLWSTHNRWCIIRKPENRKTQVAANKELMRLAIVKGQHSVFGGFHFSFFPPLFGSAGDRNRGWWEKFRAVGVKMPKQMDVRKWEAAHFIDWLLLGINWGSLTAALTSDRAQKPSTSISISNSTSTFTQPGLKPGLKEPKASRRLRKQSCQSLSPLPAVNEHSTG